MPVLQLFFSPITLVWTYRTGMPLENSYFSRPSLRDFSDSWFLKHYQPMFESVELHCTNRRAVRNHQHGHRSRGWLGRMGSILSSLRGGAVCGQCWEEPAWIAIFMSNEIITFLGKEPIKQAASTLIHPTRNVF